MVGRRNAGHRIIFVQWMLMLMKILGRRGMVCYLRMEQVCMIIVIEIIEVIEVIEVIETGLKAR